MDNNPQAIAESRAAGLRFLRGCFSDSEWSGLMADEEFRNRLAHLSSLDDAEMLLSLGLRWLERNQRNALPAALCQAA
jgi:hypothetical protein